VPPGMTGFGRGAAEHPGGLLTVEIRTVNNRFLKLSTRLPDHLAELEPEVESRVRAAVKRGSVQLQVRQESGRGAGAWRLNEEALREWLSRLSALAAELGQEPPTLRDLLPLPGAVTEDRPAGEVDATLKLALFTALESALAGLTDMRRREGEALAADLLPRVHRLAEWAALVRDSGPAMVAAYRDRIKARVERLLADSEARVEETDLAREVAYFADRSDVTEETTRLIHHCEQFEQTLKETGEVGRRLDFMAQEMLREANTLGSKAGDAETSSVAVAMKSEIEKIKEQVQNLE
jgi:uncharacterized protein (TIGR00255 family)